MKVTFIYFVIFNSVMEKSLLLQLTGEIPLFKIIDYLIDNKGLDVSKKDIIDNAEISRSVLFKYWPQLEKHNIVKITRRFGKTKSKGNRAGIKEN